MALSLVTILSFSMSILKWSNVACRIGKAHVMSTIFFLMSDVCHMCDAYAWGGEGAWSQLCSAVCVSKREARGCVFGTK